MKTIYFIRHAKTIHDGVTPDFERYLEPRGHSDALLVATRLKNSGANIEKFISSPAIRALQTAQIFSQTFECERKIKEVKALYASTAGTIIDVINEQKDKFSSIAIVGHNNEITDVCEVLCGAGIAHIPTSGVVAINFEVKSWKEIEPNTGKKILFDYPKRQN